MMKNRMDSHDTNETSVDESQGIFNNQRGNQSQCSGVSHDVTIPDITSMVRDPLNDPELNGKMNEGKYRFDDFNWLSNMAGFHKPTDVYYGTILIGTIESDPKGDAYRIISVQGIKGTTSIQQDKNNRFKTKDDATVIVHHLWKLMRHGD